jgi:hypothetical protein
MTQEPRLIAVLGSEVMIAPGRNVIVILSEAA